MTLTPLIDSLPWIQKHRAVILTLTLVVAAVLLVIGVVATWLSSRGHFMLLDGTIRNRGAIAAPWREYRREGNSLFRCRFWLGLIYMIGLTMVVGGGIWLVRDDLRASLFNSRPPSVGGTLVGVAIVVLLLTWGLAMGVVTMLLQDFVAPVMLLRRIPVMRAWRIVFQSIVKDHPGTLALYIVIRFLLDMSIGVLSLIVILCTCCIAAIPYIGSVILLPLTAFRLIYPLAFLEQFGPDWRIFPSDALAAPSP
ncbi:MAG: hypothetical protein VKO39_05900 [Cyanobacteriota bacterium]|nr:hypothetical protein [Cyanobacteriota bacterium]